MQTKKLEIEVPKEITEVGEAIGAILKIAGEQLKDGWQTGTDLPPILAGAFGGLMTAIEGIQNIPEDFKLDPFMAELGLQIPIQLGVKEMLSNLKKK